MKKYHNFAELLIDYREINNLSQLDLASLLDVDVRTVNRWEKSISLIKPDKEKYIVEKLLLPYQLIHNLNSEHPIPVFYDMNIRTYSLSPMFTKIKGKWLKLGLPSNKECINQISTETDMQLVEDYRDKTNKTKPIKKELIRAAAKYLPEINLILYSETGFYLGHICVLPLKNSSYLKIKNKEIDETDININDLTGNFTESNQIFYFYSIDADSFENTYNMTKPVLEFFNKKKFKDYLFAGITYRQKQVEILKEMGLNIIWEDTVGGNENNTATMLEGNFNHFLFGKKNNG